ncbi:MAG: class I SAM-dependent methyltransferase [Chitinophagaceae bacterium]|nr:class I SAM-dependent methyltransferase [Chitinophagaceae bacterium]
MFEFHKEKETYFNIQKENATKWVIPFVEKGLKITPGMKVLEIGCAEGGVLKAFLDRGCKGVGVELSPSRAELARHFLQNEIAEQNAQIIAKDIYDPSFSDAFKNAFDLIILKDVIEHIHDQQRLMEQLKKYLRPTGRIFFGFPPWYMPFGGHQQICKSKWLSKLPYYHLLPMSLYKLVLKWGGESQQVIDDMAEIKETGISIERFEKIVKRLNYVIDQRMYYLINPIYEYKFGWKAQQQNKLVASVPWLRDVFTTAMYYLIAIGKE